MLHNINLLTLRGLTSVRKIDKLESTGADVFHSQKIFRTVVANKQTTFQNLMTLKFSSIYNRINHIIPGFERLEFLTAISIKIEECETLAFAKKKDFYAL